MEPTLSESLQRLLYVGVRIVADLINEKAEGQAATRPYIGLENIESYTGRLNNDAELVEADAVANAFDSRHILFIVSLTCARQLRRLHHHVGRQK